MCLLGHLCLSCFRCGVGIDVFFLLPPSSEGLHLARQTPLVYSSLEKTDTVFFNLILRRFYSVPVCETLLQWVAHSKSQELNDELSVWSQIYAWLPPVCIKSQQGGRNGNSTQIKVLCKPSRTISPLPTPPCISPQSCVPDTEHHDSPPHRCTALLSLPHYHWNSTLYGLKQIVIILSSSHPDSVG